MALATCPKRAEPMTPSTVIPASRRPDTTRLTTLSPSPSPQSTCIRPHLPVAYSWTCKTMTLSPVSRASLRVIAAAAVTYFAGSPPAASTASRIVSFMVPSTVFDQMNVLGRMGCRGGADAGCVRGGADAGCVRGGADAGCVRGGFAVALKGGRSNWIPAGQPGRDNRNATGQVSRAIGADRAVHEPFQAMAGRGA